MGPPELEKLPRGVPRPPWVWGSRAARHGQQGPSSRRVSRFPVCDSGTTSDLRPRAQVARA